MSYVYIKDEYEPYLDILIDCIKLNGKNIEEQIKRITDDTDITAQCLEDNFLNFKLHSKKVRDEYEKAVNEEIDKSEKVWRRCNELIKESQPTIEQVKKNIQGLLNLLDEVDNSLDILPIYKAEKLIELIDKFNRMPSEEKELFSKILEINKNN